MTLNPANKNVTTAGSATLTTDQVMGGFLTRTGPSGGFTDTLPATASLLAALGNVPTPFVLRYINASAQTCTLAIGDARTMLVYAAGLLGAVVIATHQEVEILFTPTGTAQNPGLTATVLTRHTLV